VTLRYIADRMLDAPPARLVHFILETGITGDVARSAREGKAEHGASFAARDSSIPFVFQGPAGETVIDTDQLLESLFFGSRIEPQVATFLYVPFFETMEKMIEVLVADKGLAAQQRLADRGVIQLREFGAAVAIASELGCSVIIDL
jgi:hypothetical protein